jgi:glutamate-ammonia-ligase adenylyltransferase
MYTTFLREQAAFANAMILFGLSGYLSDVLAQSPEEYASLSRMTRVPGARIDDYLTGPIYSGVRWESPVPDAVFHFAATADILQPEKLRLLRRHYKHLCFVSGARDVLERRPVNQSLSERSAMADDVIQTAYAMAGQPEGLAILALGRLGSCEFGIFSDADLIFVRDEALPPEDAKRAVQQIMHILSAYTREGAVFAVDARLRPHGAEGDLITTPARLTQYCQGEIDSWEALTYTKMRFLCGSRRAADSTAEAITFAFARFQQDQTLATSVLAMRNRLEKLAGQTNWKNSAGGLYDIDFLTGFLLLRCGAEMKGGPLRDRLWRLADLGALSKVDAAELDHAAELFRSAEHVTALVSGRPSKWVAETKPAVDATEQLLGDILGTPFPNGVAASLQASMSRVREIYLRNLH